jgi:serine/threonine-protein kinase mTOR
MLINAMEVTGIEGTYRITCEKVMKVLRNNKDSLMAVLEAFVYDPLLNWRLIEGICFLQSFLSFNYCHSV